MEPEFSVEQIIAYAEQKGWQWTQEGAWIRFRSCPLCKSSSRSPFALNAETGAGKCHHCGFVGGLHTLKRTLGDVVSTAAPRPQRKLHAIAPNAIWEQPHAELTGNERLLAAFCARRALKPETVKRFRFGAKTTDAGIATVVPYFRGGKFQYAKLKLRTSDGGKRVWREPKGSESCVFNLDAVSGYDRIVICEGEEDCAVLTELGVGNVVSVPDGAQVGESSRATWLDSLEPYREVVIAFDRDQAGTQGAERLAKLLGRERCRIAVWPEGVTVPATKLEPEHEAKDPTDFARAGKAQLLLDALRDAQGWDNPLVRHIADPAGIDELRRDHESALPHGLPTGWKSVDEYLGGIRRSEVTVVTGHTGCGKSALVSNLAVHLAACGTAVLLASFELQLVDVRWRILQRITGKYPFTRADGSGFAMTADERERGIEIMRSLPLYVVNQFGGMQVDEYLETCRYAARRFECAVMVLDHLHFMTQAAGEKERFALTSAIYGLKDLAIRSNVGVVAVVHPSRNARDRQEPEATDLHGAAALEQVADNVLSVARVKTDVPSHIGQAKIAVKKLRRGRSGTLGSFEIAFNRAGETFSDGSEVNFMAEAPQRSFYEGSLDDF